MQRPEPTSFHGLSLGIDFFQHSFQTELNIRPQVRQQQQAGDPLPSPDNHDTTKWPINGLNVKPSLLRKHSERRFPTGFHQRLNEQRLINVTHPLLGIDEVDKAI